MASPRTGQTNSTIVAIVALVILAGLALFFFAYIAPMMRPQQEQPPADGVDVNIRLPAPQPEPEPYQPPPSY